MGFGISQFFKKIQGSFAGEIILRQSISAIILRYTKIEIPFEKIKIKNGIVQIETNQSGKSQLYIKKSAILKEISESHPSVGIKDIR